MQQILDIMFRYFLNFVQLAHQFYEHNQVQMDGLVQERRNSNANALEFRHRLVLGYVHKIDGPIIWSVWSS